MPRSSRSAAARLSTYEEHRARLHLEGEPSYHCRRDGSEVSQQALSDRVGALVIFAALALGSAAGVLGQRGIPDGVRDAAGGWVIVAAVAVITGAVFAGSLVEDGVSGRGALAGFGLILAGACAFAGIFANPTSWNASWAATGLVAVVITAAVGGLVWGSAWGIGHRRRVRRLRAASALSAHGSKRLRLLGAQHQRIEEALEALEGGAGVVGGENVSDRARMLTELARARERAQLVVEACQIAQRADADQREEALEIAAARWAELQEIEDEVEASIGAARRTAERLEGLVRARAAERQAVEAHERSLRLREEHAEALGRLGASSAARGEGLTAVQSRMAELAASREEAWTQLRAEMGQGEIRGG